jgi:hypothetical protein
MTHFLAGFTSSGNHNYKIVYLVQANQVSQHVKDFRDADNAILIFPLYTDAMPGIVKNFIEALVPFIHKSGNPSLGFVIQSGFPEPHHSRCVARYMEKLAKRLGCSHTGTVVRGGVEGIQVMPPWMTKKLYHHFYDLGVVYGKTGGFDKHIIQKLAPREKLSWGMKAFYRIGSWFGMTNFYWNSQLKSNKAFDQRFAQPFKDR